MPSKNEYPEMRDMLINFVMENLYPLESEIKRMMEYSLGETGGGFGLGLERLADTLKKVLANEYRDLESFVLARITELGRKADEEGSQDAE